MWIFEGKEFNEIPDKNLVGYVYKITNEITGKQYIGKKLFTAARSKRVKGKTKKFRVESDWREYCGSNKQLLHDIATFGISHFKREILYLCTSKGQCSYYEAKLQFELGVLENPDKFYNDWISCRITRKHLKL